ncbi:uncharacterized protein LOC129910245 [Episyrphus balteatus]|uniref:uncharacterized protein LOC129910245 n=1 Tax=Episyrphus balteatus TaxID=286459 RepID=UPI00248656EE|nr:uncharacterized protein LOC129910245 [Episyrphus balteatus]
MERKNLFLKFFKLVKSKDCLTDANKNQEAIEKAWEAIAQEMEWTVTHCKEQWAMFSALVEGDDDDEEDDVEEYLLSLLPRLRRLSEDGKKIFKICCEISLAKHLMQNK